MNFWLMKSEPGDFSIEDLEARGTEPWTGVRNYLARNYMRDEMNVEDLVLIYHSNANPSGVAGVARITRTGLPDLTALDADSKYYDPRATPDDPRWIMVEVGFVERFPEVLPLKALRDDPALVGLPLLQRGQRLSVMPIEEAHFRHLVSLGRGGES